MTIPEQIRTMVIAVMAEHLPPFLGALAKKDARAAEIADKNIWAAILKLTNDEEAMALVLYDAWKEAIMERIAKDHPELLPQKPANKNSAVLAGMGLGDKPPTDEPDTTVAMELVRITVMDGSKIKGYAYWSVTKGKWMMDREAGTAMSQSHAMPLSFQLASAHACKGQFGSVSCVPLDPEQERF